MSTRRSSRSMLGVVVDTASRGKVGGDVVVGAVGGVRGASGVRGAGAGRARGCSMQPVGGTVEELYECGGSSSRRSKRRSMRCSRSRRF